VPRHRAVFFVVPAPAPTVVLPADASQAPDPAQPEQRLHQSRPTPSAIAAALVAIALAVLEPVAAVHLDFCRAPANAAALVAIGARYVHNRATVAAALRLPHLIPGSARRYQ